MTDDPSEALAWFHGLPMDEKVAILADPRAELPVPTVKRLQAQVAEHPWMKRDPWVLSDYLTDILDAQRAQLNKWWEPPSSGKPRSPEEQAALTKHRATDLSDDIKHMMMTANLECPHHPVAVIETDHNTGQLRLSPTSMLAVYLELKAPPG